MAFATTGINQLAISIDGLDWWDYRTTDTIATVEAVGYFNSYASFFNLYDKILVTASNGLEWYYVSAVETPVDYKGVVDSSPAANTVTITRLNPPSGSVTNAMLANMAALTVKGNATNVSAVPQDIAAVAATGSVLRESGSTIGFGLVVNAGLNQMTALSVKANATNASAQPTDLAATATSNSVLRESGSSTIGFGNIKTSVITGTATNDSAAAGFLGEYTDSTQATPQALTTNTALSIASVSLGAGDWDVRGIIDFTGNVATTVTYLIASLGSTVNTLGTSLDDGYNGINQGVGTSFNNIANVSAPVGPMRFSLSTTTTIYITAQAGFAVNSCSAAGHISARRVR